MSGLRIISPKADIKLQFAFETELKDVSSSWSPRHLKCYSGFTFVLLEANKGVDEGELMTLMQDTDSGLLHGDGAIVQLMI